MKKGAPRPLDEGERVGEKKDVQTLRIEPNWFAGKENPPVRQDRAAVASSPRGQETKARGVKKIDTRHGRMKSPRPEKRNPQWRERNVRTPAARGQAEQEMGQRISVNIGEDGPRKFKRRGKKGVGEEQTR